MPKSMTLWTIPKQGHMTSANPHTNAATNVNINTNTNTNALRLMRRLHRDA